jgi:methylthioribose-1-phosphate isomerase
VIVGADRIAANGDVANKIGTYTLAVLAKRHRLPFYVAAPLSTFDPETPDGSRIRIEERGPDEVTGYRGKRWAPKGVKVRNPAFDVTPADLVTAIICEKAVIRSPNRARLKRLFKA